MLEGMAVARQEALEPEDVTMVGATDDDRAADTGLDEADPAEDQGAHDALADFSLGNQQRSQPFRGNDQGADHRGRTGIDKRWSAAQLCEFAHEGAGVMGDDQTGTAELVAPRHGDLAGQNDNEAAANLAELGQRIAGGEATDLAEAEQPLDLHWIEDGKDLLVAAIEDRRMGCG